MRESEAQRDERARGRARREGGFTIIQMVITCAVIAIAATFAIMGIASARTSMRVQSSARQFAGYLEKARSDAIRRHATSTVQITAANATSYIVTMDFNLDGATESRVISLEDEVIINHDAVTITFDWRGRLTTEGISLSFEGPGGDYAVQLDVTGSGDVTLGEETFLDADVPTVTLNNGGAGGDVLNDVAAITPPTPTTPPVTVPPVTVPPVTVPPVTTPPVTTPPVTTPPVTVPPVTTPPPPSPPGNSGNNGNNQPPSTPPTTPPTTPPATTPPTGTSCSMTLSTTQATMRACNNGGNNCGSTAVAVTLTFAAAGTSVTASTVPSNLSVSSPTLSGNVYTFTITARNNTRTTNSVVFSGCGSQSVSITTN